MAKDLPEHKQNVAIQPAGGGSSAREAFSSSIKSAENMAALGADIAQKSANERARLSGIEAGQNPGRKLFPAFTQADQAFVDAYKHEELQNLSFSGSQLINNTFSTAMKKPSAKSMQSFQQYTTQGIQDLLAQSQEDQRPALKRSLESAYDTHLIQLANAVETENQKALLSNFKATSDENAESIYNYQLQGFPEAAKNVYETQLKNIDNALKNGYIDAEQARYQRNVALLNNQQAYYNKKAMDAEEEGKGEQFLKDLVTKPPEHLTPVQAEQVNAGVMKFLGQRRQQVHGQQYIDSIHAHQDLISGQMTPSLLSEYKQKLSGADFAKLELTVARVQAKENESVNLFNQMQSQFSSPAGMAKYTPAEVDDAFGRVVSLAEQAAYQQTGQQQQATLLDRAVLAQDIKAPIPTLIKQLENTVQYGDAPSALEASRAIRLLQNNNPIALKGTDKNAIAVSNLYDQYARNTSMSGEDALKAARGDVYNVDENKKRERLEALSSWKKDTGLNDYATKLTFIAEGIGATKGLIFKTGDATRVPAGLSTVFDDLLQSTVQRVGNPKLAAQMVLDELKTVYQPTNVNNRKEIMAMPPESVLPENGHWVQNDKLRALKQVVDLNEDKRKKGEFTFGELSWPDAPKTDDLLSEPLMDGDVEILVDGVPRKIVITSDAITQLSPSAQPSWGFAYVDDNGLEMPLMDLSTPNAVARWRPDYKELQNQFEQYRDRKLTGAKDKMVQQKELDKLRIETFSEGY